MSIEGQMRVAYYLRVSTESQELENQRTEILPFIDRRGWEPVHAFEDVMSGRKSEKDRPQDLIRFAPLSAITSNQPETVEMTRPPQSA